MRTAVILLASVSVIGLTACTSSQALPVIAYDTARFVEAVKVPDPPAAVRFVEQPVPVAMPGQLVPVPNVTKINTLAPTARVLAANKAALREPQTQSYINAIQVYPYMEGALYRLYTAPEKVSDIALEPGEHLIAISAGDTARWVIGDTKSGAGETAQVHILVKPYVTGLKTNLIITTDKRTYHLTLESTSGTAMAAISWRYPQGTLIALKEQAALAEQTKPAASGITLEDLRFRYDIKGDSPSWRPVRVFDDGTKVYIEFPQGIAQGEAPPLFVVGEHGDAQLVNYRMRGSYYIVDRLFAAAELRLGGKVQSIVRIERNDVRPAGKVKSVAGGRHD
ncbi:P-type conjugative transfer protein TrbG [Asticcacaulis sp. SL142]|uniref:P-type conjugative transfer protein TrbG n=1 Tax=Asticcacaulis sp. SL142 TaxID=2995155 RepID=UPI00226C8B46|nr:P-type conjugative transfer protein TrbG [Asticcacaulis sp. SL142]WAC49735.1 P-type conjugative transfer protein TrbG [Asticcacaulis sp. SL142]